MSRTVKVVLLVVAACLVLGYCSKIIRPSRPMFAWKYDYHPDRPTLPRWWFEPPMADDSESEATVDTELNLIVVRLESPVVTALPWGERVDDSGRLIVMTGTRDGDMRRLTGRLEGTPIVRGKRDRMFLRTADGAWHEHTVPPALAESFRTAYGAGGNGPLRSLLLDASKSDEELTAWVTSVWPATDADSANK